MVERESFFLPDLWWDEGQDFTLGATEPPPDILFALCLRLTASLVPIQVRPIARDPNQTWRARSLLEMLEEYVGGS